MNLVRLCRSAVALAALVLLTGGLGGCTNSPTAPSSYAPYSQTDLRVGTGTTALPGSIITVHYTGWLLDASKTDQKGLQFETSAGGTPFTFTLGAGQVIAGWDQGVAGMNAGGLRRLIIPPSLGYGPRRNAIIPPNTTILFDVELVAVQ